MDHPAFGAPGQARVVFGPEADPIPVQHSFMMARAHCLHVPATKPFLQE
jgi:hypothetical protein